MSMRSGLEGVVAADTALSEVDGAAGRLIIRGHRLDELVGHRSFEQVLQLLFENFFEPARVRTLVADLGVARREVFSLLPELDQRLLSLPPIEAVRALMARLPDGEDHRTALWMLAAPAVFTAAVLRSRAGKRPIEPDAGNEHAADFLRMLRGDRSSAAECAALDQYLVTVVDHGFNASTFAARVVASTRAGLTSSTLAALSALKGPLHGGAPGPVLDMLDAIGSPQNAAAWLEGALVRGERLMGFGHRIYRVRDPRADALRRALQTLSALHRVPDARLELAEAVQETALSLLRRAKLERSLETNVEFYTALLLEALEIPRAGFTCVFAMGRVGGWIAHSYEQIREGRLIRPESNYIGPRPRDAR
jgi:citrate synthase